jgi:hypothetical protein
MNRKQSKTRTTTLREWPELFYLQALFPEQNDTVKCQYNEIVRVTKLDSFYEISLHWNTLKMSHKCLHRRFSPAAAIESNESKGPLRACLHWSIRVARPLNSWPNLKLKIFTLSLVILIPFNINCDERAGECGYVPSIFIFLNHFQSLWSSFPLLFFAIQFFFTHFYN